MLKLIKVKNNSILSCSFKMDMVTNAIKGKEVKVALVLNQKFNLDLKKALFDAIVNNEELAMTLIDASKSLNLPLSEPNEHNLTPLLWACGLGKPRIAEAILTQANEQNIAIDNEDSNARDEFGRTPYLWACKNGWTTTVAKMIESKCYLFSSNSKDKREMTGFILACKEKHLGVIDLLMSEEVDLQAKDYYGRSGFDYLSTR